MFTLSKSIKDIHKQKKFVGPDDLNAINSKILEDQNFSGNELKIHEKYTLIIKSYKDWFSILTQVDQNDLSEDFLTL